MSTTSERLARLSPAKRALLEQRLLGRARDHDDSIPRLGYDATVPLSFAQQRLWFVDQLDPRRCVNNIPRVLRLRGALDAAAIEAALQGIVDRHAVLRSTFGLLDGQPVQRVATAATLHLHRRDIAAEDLDGLLEPEARRAFDLETDLPLRARLLRMSEQDHVLQLTFHHIASDGWSAGIIDRELAVLYAAALRGERTPLAPLDLQYADYAAWQRQRAEAGVYAEDLEYWRQQLAGAPARLLLPTSRVIPRIQTFRGARERALVSRELVAQLEALAREHGATLFGVLLAAFQALLARYTQQSDVVVGSPVAGRSRTDTWGLIGCFINSVAFRADLSANPSFASLLQQTRQSVQHGLAHQDVPFDLLVNELRPKRDPAYSPVFQVLFVLQNTPPRGLSLEGLEIEPLEVETHSAAMDLELIAEPGEHGLGLTAVYNADLFDAAMLRRLLAHYARFLAEIARDPEQRVADVALLAKAEQRVLLEWGRGKTAVIPEVTVQSAFEAQVKHAPQAVAIAAAGTSLSYRALDERANQVAQALIAAGVCRGDRVGVRLGRTFDLVAALVGVLKAGAAYVPLDPGFPEERLQHMLSDSGARTVVDAAFMSRVGAHPGERPESGETSLDDLAYVMYTSGSTGRPKGVMISQRNLANFFVALDDVLGPEQPGVWLAVTTASFDISVVELLWTLARGFRVMLSSAQEVGDSLSSLVRTHRVTHLQCTPSLMRIMAHQPDALGSLEALQVLMLGGEALPTELARSIQAEAPGLRVLNMYGPTETTIWSTVQPVEGDFTGATVPIGRPLANTQLYVCEASGSLSPLGVPGELWIGGDGVASGYLGQPELTATRFVENSFGAGRVYRTGDRVRWLPDGTLEFLGRTDQQLKIRGHRVEPGEVEATLLRHSGVSAAAVVAYAVAPAEASLVAYVVPTDPEAPPAPADLREFLRGSLPEQMVPGAFVALERLPLTPNGKVDRLALPAPDATLGDSDAGYVAPRDQLERDLERIWARALSLPRVGIRDSFFDLGGHSLLAAELFARIAERFEARLAFASLFPHATIEAQAALIRANVPHAPMQCLVPIQPHGRRPAFLCVHGLDGDVLRFEPLARAMGEDQPFYGVRAVGLDAGSPLPKDETVESLAARYVAELQSTLPGPYCIGGFSAGSTLAYEMARQMTAAGQPPAVLVVLDGIAPVVSGTRRRRLLRDLRYLPADLPDYVRQLFGPGILRRKFETLRAELGERVARLVAPASPHAPPHVLEAVAGFSERHYAVALAHDAAFQRYTPEPYPGRATLIRGKLRRRLVTSHDPTLGWDYLATGGVEVHTLDAPHERLLKDPHVTQVAALLHRAIDAAT